MVTESIEYRSIDLEIERSPTVGVSPSPTVGVSPSPTVGVSPSHFVDLEIERSLFSKMFSVAFD
jgi:hypothetical protein